MERYVIKKVTRKARRKLKQYKKKAEYNLEERKQIETCLLQMGKVFQITNETGTELNKNNVKEIPEKELIPLFEHTIKEFEKEV